MKWLLVAAAVICYIAPADGAKEVNPKIFAKYTDKAKGCTCWWDLERNDCACCKKKINGKKADSQQCGYPMHKYCYKKIRNKKTGAVISRGCPGVPQNKLTLSTKGYACYFLPTNGKQCAWCADGGYQCGPGAKAGITSELGNHCHTGKNLNYCDAVLGDCRHIPGACSREATCEKGNKVGKTQLYTCKCNKGWTGNGVDCFDENGNLPEDPADTVEMEITMASDFFVYPHQSSQFPATMNAETLISEMRKL